MWSKKVQEDSLICEFGSKEIYLSKALYSIVSLRGAQAIFLLVFGIKKTSMSSNSEMKS